MYDASLQSLESGIVQSAPQPAAELMQQADVVEKRLGEVYKAAGVGKGYSLKTNTSQPQLTSEASATDVGTLFSDYSTPSAQTRCRRLRSSRRCTAKAGTHGKSCR